MKVLIDGVEDEYQLIQTSRESFTCEPGEGNVWFSEFFLVRAKPNKEYPKFSDIYFTKICPDEKGDSFYLSQEMAIYTTIDDDLLREIIEGYKRNACMDLDEAAEKIIFDFLQHDTPFTLEAAKYAMEVLSKDSPVRNALALKTGLDGIR